jgi:MYXO-CTERM domain-containing protein
MGVCIGRVGSQCQALCTGTLIAPNLVLTARHCVANIVNPNPQDTNTVTCGTTKFSATNPASDFAVTTNTQMCDGNFYCPSTGFWAHASQVITPPATDFCGNDLALLILSSNVPASAATPATPNVMYDLRDRSHISKLQSTAIGYGLTDPATMNTAGTRHMRSDLQFNCIPGDRYFDCATHGYPEVADAEFMVANGTCEGDSGSGAFSQAQFDQGQFLSLGMLSRGGVDSTTGQCVDATYTRTDSWRDLIIQTANTAATMGGYTPPSWVSSAPPSPPNYDGGTHPQPDASTSDSGSSGQLGDPCTDDSHCDSMACRALNGGANVCTQSCDGMNACPNGYACKYNYCFVAPGSNSNQAQSAGSSGGCAIATTDPSKPIPWFAALGAVALAGGLARRRRR